MPENPEVQKVKRSSILDLEDLAQYLDDENALALRQLVKFYFSRQPQEASYIEGGIVLDYSFVATSYSQRPPRAIKVFIDHPEVGKLKMRVSALPKTGQFVVDVNNRVLVARFDPFVGRVDSDV